MGKMAGSATAGLAFLDKDTFEGTGSGGLFNQPKPKGTGMGKAVTIKAGGTRITVRSGAEEGKAQREPSISENIESLLDLGNLSTFDPTVGGKKGKRSRNAIEDLLEF